MSPTPEQQQVAEFHQALAEVIATGGLTYHDLHVSHADNYNLTASVTVSRWADLDKWSASLGNTYECGSTSVFLASLAHTPLLVEITDRHAA